MRENHRVPSDQEFREKVLRGSEQAERGEVIPHSQVKRELEQWLRTLERRKRDSGHDRAD